MHKKESSDKSESKQRKSTKKSFFPSGIGLIVTGMVFVLLFLTNFITNLLFMMLPRPGGPPMRPGSPFFPILIQNAFLSIIIGTILTLFVIHLPLRPLHTIIRAIHDVAEGKFDTKLYIEHPKEFRELSHSFNQMTSELSGIEILRSDFINNFSHEFKTPIVSILGFAKLLKKDTLSSRERDEYLDIIIDESSRLASLSANILNLSKVESISLLSDFTSFRLSEQIRESIVQLENQWAGKKIDFDLELAEVKIRGNESLLKQVWINLIDNAVKFSPENSAISISLLQQGDSALFSIRDQGAGMDGETQKHIFEKFYQGDKSHAAAGNGLGLSLVKRIVELHHGTVTVESELEKGSTFCLMLPL